MSTEALMQRVRELEAEVGRLRAMMRGVEREVGDRKRAREAGHKEEDAMEKKTKKGEELGNSPLLKTPEEPSEHADHCEGTVKEEGHQGVWAEGWQRAPLQDTEEMREAGAKASGKCNDSSKKSTKKVPREFDFEAHPRRHVALRLAYWGWNYQGFACQENTENTVEAKLFEALVKTRLIKGRQSSNYHRCGRTDKGVSAFSQVISIDLRSTQFSGVGVMPPNKESSTSAKSVPEMPYTKMLNRVLPEDIRVLGWAPVPADFSARFDCQSRTYRYYFPRGNLDIELMARAAKRFEGTQDFRNVCKMDVGNGVLKFERTILCAEIRPIGLPPGHGGVPYELFVFEVTGLAFLYHQVRCMMAILLLIGQKLEDVEIIDQLLDVDSNPRKPQYSMAVDFPLVLYRCSFPGLSWQDEDPELSQSVLSRFQQQWVELAVKAEIVRDVIRGLPSAGASFTHCPLVEGSRARHYCPLLQRPLCESLESRIDHFVRRGRLEKEEESGDLFPQYRQSRNKNPKK
ncbi:tRNA pseudouridine(38/39) synthase isoform X2 [Erpetoichthys calabaricus]|uniref:tRNA pseudouridine(38/39) synthase isoform X2 n=1 Tax=Erpetoichthys calabaricus TaxID=27687 RepID=UPI002234A1D3|nr:tRNA pseudouridine(38/39) synthase isoform X2 [Erpetoichthys calabaricus]